MHCQIVVLQKQSPLRQNSSTWEGYNASVLPFLDFTPVLVFRDDDIVDSIFRYSTNSEIFKQKR
jgi:hypothetical protein